jgi:UDP-3-O-[3-hydroxymyristoyl] N-acetylglucosamine deacetylase
MAQRWQRTIAEKVACAGVGLHSGHAVEITLHPARPDQGVVFRSRWRNERSSWPNERSRSGSEVVEIPARAEYVVSTDHATTLAVGDCRVATVEHLLACLFALQIDNVTIDVEGDELPALDGSAEGFVRLVEEAGVFEQDSECRTLDVTDPIEIVDGLRRIRIEPAPSLCVSYSIDFAHPAIGRQTFEIDDLDGATFGREIASARTFAFLDEVDALWRAGLARGGSLANTVVLDAEGVVNEEGLRFSDEFVRHKVTDLIGDLALIGRPLRGRVVVERGGHALHQQLVRALVTSISD